VHFRQNDRLTTKCLGGTINHKLSDPRLRLPIKGVQPKSCSLRPLHDGASSGHHSGDNVPVKGSLWSRSMPSCLFLVYSFFT
jgi:hypothetical protein